jgi:hypothetical protein
VNTTIGTSIAAGKPKKVALTACMGERLTIINAMMRTNTTWRQLDQLVAYLADHGRSLARRKARSERYCRSKT